MEYTEAKVKDIFVDFLKSFKDLHDELKYRIQISQLAPRGGKSVVVDYTDLLRYNTDLATSLIREPESFLKSFDDAAFETLYIENPIYADKIKKELRIRIRELTDRLSLRGVTKSQLNSMILVAGMVTRTSELRPLAVNAAFVCSNKHVTFVEQSGVILKRPVKCDTEDCGETKNFELDDMKTEFIDFQVIKIQEMPEELPPGQLPQSFDVHLTGDIVNTARPGDRIVLTGIVKAESEYAGGSARLRLFSTRIIANFVEQLGKRPEEAEITREEEEQIRALAASPGAYDRIVASVAPAILGHELHKEAVLLLMVGSPQKTLPDGSTLRGDISLLLVGDPGTAKSELLKYVARVAPRGLYTSGRGTSLDFQEPVIIRRSGTVQVLKIGELVDSYYLQGASGVFVPVHDLECLSYDQSIGKIQWRPVTFVFRHRHDKPLIRIRLQTGREVVVTDDHSLFAVRGGRLVTVKTKDLHLGDCVAIPGRMPLNTAANLNKTLYPAELLNSPHLARLLGYYIAEGYLHAGKKGNESYRIHFELNRNETRIIQSINSDSMALFGKGVTIRYRKGSQGITLTISSKRAFMLFRDVFGVSQGARLKRVPTIVFNMPKELQIEFILSYLEGDRGVTSSPFLRSDLLYLMSISIQKVGKFSESRPSSGKIHDRIFKGGPCFRMKAPNPYRFDREIKTLGPPLEHILTPFKKVLDSPKHGLSLITNQHYSRLTPLIYDRLMIGKRMRRFSILSVLRERGEMTTPELAREVGIPRRSMKQILVNCARDHLVELSLQNGIYHAVLSSEGKEALTAIDEVKTILTSDLQFALVKSIGRTRSSTPYVYDLSVQGTENFVAGSGGVLCHNTAAGLTAAVVKEKNGMMMLEAGATVLADLGVACLHPSSKVVLNGRIVGVEDVANELTFVAGLSEGSFAEVATLDGRVPSLNIQTLRMESAEVAKLRRRWHAGRIVTVKLRSGFELSVTPDHLLLNGNTLEWSEARSFAKGDSVVGPLLLPQQSGSKRLFLWDVLPEDTKVSLTSAEREELRSLIRSKFASVAAAGRDLGLPRLEKFFRERLQPSLGELRTLVSSLGIEERWRATPHVYDRSRMYTSEITPEFAYICGFILGDGYVSITKRHATITIHQSEVHLPYIEQFRKCWSKVFQLPFKVGDFRQSVLSIRGKESTSRAANWHVSRRVLARVFSYLTKDNLGSIVSLPEDVLAGFIAGLTDADGCITKKNSIKNGQSYETWNIVYTFSSNHLANLNLVLGLRRFDCLASYRGVKNGVGVIVVSGRRDCIQLQKSLPYSIKMQRQPSPRRYNISGASEKIPSVPTANLLRSFFAQTSRAELLKSGIWSTVYEIMNLKRRASTSQISKIVSKYPAIPDELRAELLKITNRDYFLDDIVELRESDYSGYVYDFVLKGESHNFVADGAIVHNCIDEFDKMRDEDRSALHEVMEQQTASVAKGGIIATLNARTSILAAANPVDGKYDPYKNILDNVSLPIPLLTRFDLVFIIRDEADPSRDESVAKHILDMRARSSFPTQPAVEFDLLKKYITYAKKIDPELTEEARTRLSSFYIKLRREASPEQISVTPRWLEGMIRLSIARARVLLHNRVTEDDALHAIKLIERMLNTVAIDQTTKKVDVGVLYNRPVSEKGLREAALEVFKKLSGESKQPVENKAFYDELVKSGNYSREQAEKVFQDMYRSGVIYEVKPNFFKKT